MKVLHREGIGGAHNHFSIAWAPIRKSLRTGKGVTSFEGVGYAPDVTTTSTGPRVKAVISGMTSNCLIEMFRTDGSSLSRATNGPFR